MGFISVVRFIFAVEAPAQTRSGQSIPTEDRGFISSGDLVVARIVAREIRGVRDHREVRKHVRTHDRGSTTVSGTGNTRVITGFYQWNDMRTGRPFGSPIKYEATVSACERRFKDCSPHMA